MVARIDPDGRETDRIEMPVSCPCLGGEHLDRLYVTTADGAPEKETWDGALFEITGPFRGLLPYRSRILL
jgi:sugar lactone lactonase YvrE